MKDKKHFLLRKTTNNAKNGENPPFFSNWLPTANKGPLVVFLTATDFTQTWPGWGCRSSGSGASLRPQSALFCAPKAVVVHRGKQQHMV